MKKILLSIVFALISLVTAYAAQLNPFAYGLSSTFDKNTNKLTVSYKLNSTATSVKVVIVDGTTDVQTVDCSSLGLTKGSYTKEIELSGSCPRGKSLTWRVDVTGNTVKTPTKVDKVHSLYHPSSIDIDNNPENETFGKIFCVEGLNNLHSSRNPSDSYSQYLSYGSGAGLYMFDASFTHQKTPSGENGFDGGVNFSNLTYSIGSKTAYTPRRVRITKDGRIFISTQILVGSNNTVLWEMTSFNEPWKHIMSGSVTDCTDANFNAAPNVAFDVRGEGSKLEFAMLSATTGGFVNTTPSCFRLSTYSMEHNGTPELNIKDVQDKLSTTANVCITYDATQVEYDENGDIWICQGRGAKETSGNKTPSLVHYNAGTQEMDLVERRLDRRGGAIRFSNDYKQIVVSGKYEGTVSGVHNYYANVDCTKGWATVYNVTEENDAPKLTFKYSIDMTSISQTSTSTSYSNINDYVWDFAGNLYAVSHIAEKIAVWAMPYSGSVSTPAASKFSFELEPQYGDPQLAPFAYDLRRTKEGDGRVKLHFMLNAHARRVKVILEDKQASKEYVLRDYPISGSDKNYVPYHSQGYGTVITTEDIERLGLSYNKNYSWRVDVYGEDVANPTCVRSYDFYHPSAVDIDNNPNNETFGLILSNETMQEIYHKSGYGSYHSYDLGAGIYAFSPNFKPIMNGDKKGFNGGKKFSTTTHHYAPRRIRISKDGRIFATAQDNSGEYLWEIDPTNLDNWTSVFKGTNNNYVLKDGSGNFIAGTNAGFDVRGVGGNLQLLMLSADKPGSQVANSFKLHEYNLETNTAWSTVPTRELEGCHLHSSMITSQAQVQYDNEGGYWITYWVNSTASADIYGGIAHFTKNGVKDFSKNKINMRNAGFRFNHDFSKVIIATNDVTGASKTYKQATIYVVTKDANGAPVLTKERTIDMTLVGNNLNDFAWDYAGNLYVCGNSGEKLAAYVMPRSQTDVVSTPARDEYVVSLTEPVPCIVAYNLTYKLNDATKKYDFSFYANTQPTSATIRFYKNSSPKTLLYTHTIGSPVKGNNKVSIPMATLDAKLNNEYDITWEVELSAPESRVFGKIYKSAPLNTAYATIDVNPESDYFGQIYAANQQNHPFTNSSSGGNVYVWAPGSNGADIYHTTKEGFLPTLPSGQKGLSQAFRPCVAPDGKVYLTDNGVNGGLYVLDPKNYTTTSFFDGCTQGEKSRWLASGQHVGSPSSGAHIYWIGGNTAKLFLTRTECYEQSNIGSQGLTMSRHNEGYFTYQLTKTDGQWQHNWQGNRTMVQVNDDNLYQTDFAIVGSSRGTWLCQHRYNDEDVWEARSLMFFDNNGERQYCSDDDDIIYGSSGAALAINKDETILAMASGNGGIMFFDINWNGNIPRLAHKYTAALNENKVVTSLNFDYAGNLVATVGDTYDDRTDKHRMVVFTMPKANNTITVPARFNQRVASLYADEREEVHFDQVETNAYQTVDVYRPLVAGMYNTICLPFSLSTLDGTPYQGATVMKFTNATYDDAQQVMNFNFTKVSFQGADILEAGVPYLIQPAKDIEGVVRFTSVGRNTDFANKGLSVTNNTVTFHGTINPKNLSVNANYLFLVANNRLATASEGGDMLGLRGYFTVNGAQPTKAVISFRDESATGTISITVQTDNGARKVLQDQQVIILKDDKTYNMTGATVK